MDFPELLKRFSAVVTTGSLLLYGTGYLSLRARARALGTEPAFDLIDQIYIFNGFRLAFAILFALAVIIPIGLFLVSLWRLLPAPRSGGLQAALEWLVVAWIYCIALLSLRTLEPAGVLLESSAKLACLPKLAGAAGAAGSEPSRTGETADAITRMLDSAVLCSSGPFTALIFLGLVASLAAGLAWWLAEGQALQMSKMVVLAPAIAILLLILPVFHGAYLADREVRVLSQVPATAAVLRVPVAIVDRTASQLSLFGHDGEGRPAIIIVAADDIKGLPARESKPLEEFLAELGTADPDATPKAGIADHQQPSAASSELSVGGEVTTADLSPGFRRHIGTALEEMNIVLVNLGNLGGEDQLGELWAVNLDAQGNLVERRRIGDASNLAWPVAAAKNAAADGADFVVIQDGSLVAFNKDGGLVYRTRMGSPWQKLIGITSDGSVLGLIDQNGTTIVAKVSAGAFEPGDSPASDADTMAVKRLQQPTRLYQNGARLEVKRSESGGRGFDVFLQRDGRAINISECGDHSCTQPSMSPDQTRIVYIKTRAR